MTHSSFQPTLGRTTDAEALPVILDPQRLLETRLAVQSNSGSGKSWLFRRLAEQLQPSGIQQIVIDPDDEYHTLRERGDYVLAGEGGDCPADLRGAELLARRLLELGASAIVNIYELGARRADFVHLFLGSLMAAPKSLWHPVFVFLDEAHLFCPEAGQGAASSTPEVIDLMSRGRKRGFCGILATQRIAKLNKNALAEVNNKLVGRAGLDTDYKRAGAEIGMTSREDFQTIKSMPAGEFFAYGPAFTVDGRHGVQRVKIGPVHTTHIASGQRDVPRPPPRAKIMKVLGELADLPHEAEAEARDAAGLREQVAELRRQLAVRPPPAVEERVVEKPVFDEKHVRRFEVAIDRLVRAGAGIQEAVQPIHRGLALFRALGGDDETLTDDDIPFPEERDQDDLARAYVEDDAAHAPNAGTRSPGPLVPAQQRVIDTIALLRRLQIAPTRDVLASYLGVGPKQPAFHKNLSALRTAGLVAGFDLTRDGAAAARVVSMPTQAALRQQILRPLVPAQQRLVELLLEAGRGLSRAELAGALGVGEKQPAMHKNLSALRTRQLVTKGWPVAAGRVLYMQGAS